MKRLFFIISILAFVICVKAQIRTKIFLNGSDTVIVVEPEEFNNISWIKLNTPVYNLISAKDYIEKICGLTLKQYFSLQGFNGEGTIKTWYANYIGNDFQKCNLTGWARFINMEYYNNTNSNYNFYPWYYYYNIIDGVDIFLKEIDNFEANKDEVDFLKAQVYTLKAYALTMLIQFYCERWIDSNKGASKGIPLHLTTSLDEANKCGTLLDVYREIYQNLDQAIKIYKNVNIDRADGYYWLPNINVAYAVYARAALIRSDWEVAEYYAKLARNGYPLMSNDEYINGGFSTPNKEWIWGSYNDYYTNNIYFYSFYSYQGSTSKSTIGKNYPCSISKDLFNKIPETDVRKQMWLNANNEDYDLTTGEITTTNNYNLYNKTKDKYHNKLYMTSKLFAYMQFKFQGTEEDGLVGNINHFRSSEMYLIEAEALYNLGKYAESQKILNELNKERDSNYNCKKEGLELLEEIKLYRRIDLWGEGFDWFDLKRWKEPISRKSYSDGGSFNSAFAVTINPEDNNNWVWSFPALDEMYNKYPPILKDNN